MQINNLKRVFEKNSGKTAELSYPLVTTGVFQEEVFYAEAEKAGYAEARIFPPGTSLLFERKRPDRITAQITEGGYLKRLLFG